jgi:hypothetical protein
MASYPKVGVGYNAQVAVDAKHKLIVAQEVTNAGSDLGLVVIFVPKVPIWKAGYFKGLSYGVRGNPLISRERQLFHSDARPGGRLRRVSLATGLAAARCTRKVREISALARPAASMVRISVRLNSRIGQYRLLSARPRTREGLGQAINPHLFRDCAATSIAINDPAHVGIASRLLGHRTGSTTERYYNQARSVEASRLMQKSLVALRNGVVGAIDPMDKIPWCSWVSGAVTMT